MGKLCLRNLKKIGCLALADLFSIAFAYFFAHVILHGGRLPDVAADLPKLLFLGVVIFAIFGGVGLYRAPLRTAGIEEAFRGAFATLLACVFAAIANPIFDWAAPFETVLFFLLLFNAVLVSRFALRIVTSLRFRMNSKSGAPRVMIIGAGEGGAMVIREIKNSNKISFYPVCVIDDDPTKRGMRVGGVPVVGTRDDIVDKAKKYRVDQIFLAIPSAGGKTVQEICEICTRTGCKLRILPGMYQMLDGTVKAEKLRDVEINDLLGREPICVNSKEVFSYIEGKSVLVTGGGGSIGSELCRQIAAHNPKRLTIFDIYENNAYEIENELRRAYPNLDLRVLIGSVRDENRVNAVFEEVKPHIVFHAAAHKHVPLMETSPAEALKNNVFGTYNVAKAAEEFGAQRFVLISTDKAVNPTNVMGATKRICEMIVQTFAAHANGTEYVAVRFGNVLGSNGSVIPLFKRQIKEGGPVTVTHKDIIRYFMTIPEAVSLVLQAGAYAKGGEIFVLDMGEPVKILTLAENLIRLSGYTPYEDIAITFTGLRPGEKLFEELLMDEEGMKSTGNKLIYIGKPIDFDEAELWHVLEKIKTAVTEPGADLRALIKTLVPTYRYQAEPQKNSRVN